MRAVVALILLVSACVVGETTIATKPPDEGAGTVTTPRHGEIVTGNTRTATIEVGGTHTLAAQRIDVQVLDDPADPASWTTVGTTLTDSLAAANGQYAWRTIVAPGREGRRWPEGGILRLRAVDAAGDVLAVMFHDADEVAPVKNGLVLVSPSPTPADAMARPRFLERRNAIDAAETAAYYTAINAPPTLADFQTQFGFDAAVEPVIYYNAGDLGIGREMHCRALASGVACYVSNYGEFGGERTIALESALAQTGAFATVAMVYQPPASAPNSVTFMVYGADGRLANEARLDQFGDNVSIPNNCLNCHGGGRYDAAAKAVTGARFLPFDPGAFEFGDRPGFNAVDQTSRITALNQLVAMTDPPPALRELVDGLMTTPADELVAAGWAATPLERGVYKHAVAVACRSCHASLDGALAFDNAQSFTALRASIADSVCGQGAAGHDMPSAEVPMRRLWTTSARAYLVDYLDIPGACAP